MTFVMEDVVVNRLRSAALISGFMTDSGAWRLNTSLLSQEFLMTGNGDQSKIAVGLLGLLRSGKDKELKLAVDRLMHIGPHDPVIAVANEIDLAKPTRSSLKSILVFLRSAADVLTEEMSDAYALWALDVLSGDDDLVRELKVRFSWDAEIISTLSAIVPGTSEAVRRKVMDLIIGLPVVSDQMSACRYGGLIRRISDGLWTDDDVTRMVNRPAGDNFELTVAIERVIAQRDQGFRSSLEGRIAEGDFAALANYGEIRDLPGEVAGSMIDHLAEHVRHQTDQAKQSAYGLGGDDHLAALVLLNTYFPEQSVWEPVIEAISEPKSHASHIKRGIAHLGSLASRLPAEVIARLRDPLMAVAARTATDDEFPDVFAALDDPRGTASFALARLFPDEVSELRIAELAGGDSKQRRAAAELVGIRQRPSDLSLLSALSLDSDFGARRVVAYYLTMWVLLDVTSDALVILARMLDGGGVKVANAVADALVDQSESDNASSVIDLLRGSPSVSVRTKLARVVDAGRSADN